MQEMAIQLNQAYDNVEKLRAQVLQERQLRSVTESCLMEERCGWQRVYQSLTDSRQHWQGLSDAATKLSALRTEMKQQLGQTQNNNHLTNPASGELVTMATEHLFDQCLYEVRQHSSALTHNMEHIVSNPRPQAPYIRPGTWSKTSPEDPALKTDL